MPKSGLLGFGDCAHGEDKHLRVQFLWHGRPHVATLSEQVRSSALYRTASGVSMALWTFTGVFSTLLCTALQGWMEGADLFMGWSPAVASLCWHASEADFDNMHTTSRSYCLNLSNAIVT